MPQLLKVISFLSVFLFNFLSFAQIFAQQVSDGQYANRLWYKQPAVNWNDALPLGNGRLGAMIYGGVTSELIELNEATLWSGELDRDWNTPATKKYLPLIRAAALAGQYKTADSLSKFTQGPYTESYMPMADLHIEYQGVSDSSNYRRELDIDSAVSKIVYGKIQRTAFSSYPDQVIAIQNTASGKDKINLSVNLSSKLHYQVRVTEDGRMILSGKCPKHVEPVYRWQVRDPEAIQYDSLKGMNFEVNLLVKHQGGRMRTDGNTLLVENADTVTFIISGATSFNGFDKSPSRNGKDARAAAEKLLRAAAVKTFEELKRAHIKDYQSYFDRVKIDLGPGANRELPTDERLKRMKDKADHEMVALVAQYGRYLLISGSRPGGQPVNLKGIWNNRVRPEFSSNWCIDHDAQMWYYGVETNNLSEVHEPFLKLIEELSVNGKKTATINYGMRGWCAYHNTDIWRLSGSVGNYGEGNPHWASWNMSNAWLCSHLYDHYLFTGNKTFLKKEAWPVMKGAAMFLLDWLIKTKEGTWVSVPSVSPENTFITESGDTAQISVNTTSDIALAKDLLTNCVAAGTLLGDDQKFIDTLNNVLQHLAPYPIGSKGQLLEWAQEWRAVDPSHRHLSHFYPVFPGKEISPFLTPALNDAAIEALPLREPTNCSWGFSWKAGCWARVGKGDSAWSELKRQLQWVDPKSRSSEQNYGLYPNLFNSDAPNTIMNGNGCATAVLTEMLIQSHTGIIDILPALPKEFDAGKISGICARGGFVIDLSWKKGSMEGLAIKSKLGGVCKVRSLKALTVYQKGKKVKTEFSDQICSFQTHPGEVYTLK